jgi:HPr kinase/phosphorylase
MESSNANVTVHGVLVSIAGVGVLITGESGTGKSECALDLVSKGHKLVADDVVIVRSNNDFLIGTASEPLAGLIHIRDLGIFDCRRVFGNQSFETESRIDVWIELHRETDEIDQGFTDGRVLAVRVPKIRVTIDRNRNTALLAETVVKLFTTPQSLVNDAVLAKHDALVSA